MFIRRCVLMMIDPFVPYLQSREERAGDNAGRTPRYRLIINKADSDAKCAAIYSSAALPLEDWLYRIPKSRILRQL